MNLPEQEITEGVDFEIRCSVCTRPIPAPRCYRNTQTCSEGCKDKLDAKRERQRAQKRCAACLHPSTPEERQDFRLWRADRASRLGAGRTELDKISPVKQTRDHTLANKRDLVAALKSAIRIAEQAAAQILDGCASQNDPATLKDQPRAHYEELMAAAARFRKLVDKKATE